MNESYNKHYIAVDSENRVTDGWSDGPHCDRDIASAICINDEGGYQFRLFPGGEENPLLHDKDGIPLYKWDGQAVQPRTEAEISADRAAIPGPEPSKDEQRDAKIKSHDDQITDLQMVVCDLYEANMALMERLEGE